MASSTPGYCTFTATARPSWVMARCTWPIDAAAIGIGSHSANSSSGGAPSSPRRRPAASSARHRRRVRLELGEGLADRLGQALVEVAGHLAELHQGALHVAERLGDLLGGAQLVRRVELLAPLGARRTPAGPGARPCSAPAEAPSRASSARRALRDETCTGPLRRRLRSPASRTAR